MVSVHVPKSAPRPASVTPRSASRPDRGSGIVYVDDDPLVLTHARALLTNVVDTAVVEEAQRAYNQSGAIPYHPRSPAQIAGFFEGLELLAPGVVSCPRWRPDPAEGGAGLPPEVDMFGGVARKP
jgi:S-adenosyl methyltransferase